MYYDTPAGYDADYESAARTFEEYVHSRQPDAVVRRFQMTMFEYQKNTATFLREQGVEAFQAEEIIIRRIPFPPELYMNRDMEGPKLLPYQDDSFPTE